MVGGIAWTPKRRIGRLMSRKEEKKAGQIGVWGHKGIGQGEIEGHEGIGQDG